MKQKKVFGEFTAQGGTDDEILGKLYMMFQNDDLSIEELEALVHVLGYEFSPEFAAMPLEDQKVKGWEDTENVDFSKPKK